MYSIFSRSNVNLLVVFFCILPGACKQMEHTSENGNSISLSSASDGRSTGVHPHSQPCEQPENRDKCFKAFNAPARADIQRHQSKTERFSLRVAVGYFGEVVDAGIQRTFDVETEMETSLFLARKVNGMMLEKSSVLIGNDKLNFGETNASYWFAECRYSISSSKIKNFESFAYIFRNGVAYSKGDLDVTRFLRNFTFLVPRNSVKVKLPNNKESFVSIHTRQQLFNSCLEKNARLDKIREVLMSDHQRDITSQYKVDDGISILNQSVNIKIRDPDGQITALKYGDSARFPMRFAERDFQAYIPVSKTCIVWRPVKGKKSDYYAVLKGYGDRGCNHGKGCFDVEGDDVFPGPNFGNWDNACDGM